MTKLTVEMDLAKRIYDAWVAESPDGQPAKGYAVIAARIALGRSADGSRDVIWDALVEALDLHPEQITPNLRGRLNDACKQLREVNATPEQVIAKAKAYRHHHPDWELTAQSLCTHWASLRVGADGPAQTTIERELVPEPELVPPPPGFWEQVGAATRTMPD